MKVSRLRAYFSIAVVLASLIAALSGCGAAEAVTLGGDTPPAGEVGTSVPAATDADADMEQAPSGSGVDMPEYIYNYMGEDGYKAVDYTTWQETVGWPLAELTGLPDRFEKLPCIFQKNDPGIPDHLMVVQVWYDDQATQYPTSIPSGTALPSTTTAT